MVKRNVTFLDAYDDCSINVCKSKDDSTLIFSVDGFSTACVELNKETALAFIEEIKEQINP